MKGFWFLFLFHYKIGTRASFLCSPKDEIGHENSKNAKKEERNGRAESQQEERE